MSNHGKKSEQAINGRGLAKAAAIVVKSGAVKLLACALCIFIFAGSFSLVVISLKWQPPRIVEHVENPAQGPPGDPCAVWTEPIQNRFKTRQSQNP